MLYLVLISPFVVLAVLIVMQWFESWMLDDEDDTDDPAAEALAPGDLTAAARRWAHRSTGRAGAARS